MNSRGRGAQLGGPYELACDFERRGLLDDAGAGIELAASIGQRFGDRVCFNRRRVRYGLFRPCGWRVAEPSTPRLKRASRQWRCLFASHSLSQLLIS
jgi:hypothetical protein